MPKPDIPRWRLVSQRLAGEPCESAEQAVRWLGAAQAQDFHGAKWGLAQRCRSLDNTAFDACLASGRVLRTHLMRPTWHFVAAEDLGWIQRLTSARVHAANALHYRREGVDAEIAARGRKLLERNLRGGNHLTRAELATIFARHGLPSAGVGLVCVLMHAELTGVICSGPLRGRQFTYALVEERVPQALDLRGEEALRELAWRYFRSHGPATVHDFSWWSGMTVTQARRAVALNEDRLASDVIDDRTFWFNANGAPARPKSPLMHLVSIYDEHVVAYRDRRELAHPKARVPPAGDPGSLNLLLIDGRIGGRWCKDQKSSRVALRCTSFVPLNRAARNALAQRAKQYAGFLGAAGTLSLAGNARPAA